MKRSWHPWLLISTALILGLVLAAGWVSTPSAGTLQEQGPFLPFVTHGEPQPPPAPLIVDHRAPLGFPDLPDFARLGARDTRLLVRHASVGENISDGLDCLGGAYPATPGCEAFTPGVYDRSNWDFQSRGNPGWQAKIDDLLAETAAHAADYDGFTMKFCYIDALGDASPDWETYRDAMLQLENDYPGQTFIWWTIPLTSGGNAGADRFNALVRAYARANGKILFDIADIEAYDPDGNYHTSPAGYEILYPAYTDDGGHLNWQGRIRVAQAFWVLAARLNGWVW